MTPASTRARLDRSLITRGEDVTLRRRIASGNNFVSITCRARVRGYDPHELSGGIVQGDSKVIMSPSSILANSAVWPGAAGGDVYPKVNDQIIARGRLRNVQAAETTLEDGQPVRIDLTVRG